MSTTTTNAKIKLALEGASVVEAGLASVESKLAAAKGAMLGLAGGLTIGAFTSWIKHAVDAADEASKLSQKAGIAVKDVAGLTLAFEQSGMTAGDVAGAMAKLSKGMADGNKAFAAMGLTAQNQDGTLKSTRQMLGEVADKFASYSDGVQGGAEKVALAMEIFGKSGAEMIPLLNGGAEALDEFDRTAKLLGLTLDEETAKNAEKFNDTLDLMGKAGQGVAAQIASQLLPTLTSVAGEMFNAMSQGDGLRKTADFLATALKGLYIVGATVVRVFSAVGSLLGATAAATVAALSGDFAGAANIWKMHLADNAQAGKEYADGVKKVWEGTGNVAVEAASKVAKGVAPVVANGTKSAREAVSEFDKLKAKLEGDVSKGYAEAEAATHGYNKAQVKALEIFASPAWKTFTNDQRTIIAGYLEQAITAEKTKDATKALADAQKAASEAYASWIKGYTDSAANAEKRLTDMQQEAEALALSESWQISIAQAVEHTTIARLKEKQVAAMGNEELVAALQEEIEVREKIIGQLGQKEARETVRANEDAAKKVQGEWQRTWESVQSGLVDAIMQGGDSVMKWLKDSFKKLVLQPLLSPISQGGSAGDVAGGAGNALDGLGKLWDFMTGKGMGKLETGVEAFATKLGVAGDSAKLLGKAAGMAGNAIASYQMHQAVSGGYKIGDGKAMSVVSAAAGAAFGPIAGVVTGLLSRAFGRKLTETGLKATFDGKGGVQAQNYEFYKGGWFTSDKEKTSKMPGAGKFEKAMMDLQEGTARMAEALGLSGDAVRKFAGELKINLMGLSEAEAAKKIEEELLNIRVKMLEAVPGIEAFAQAGETTGEAMRRLVQETDEALQKAGISSQAISDVIVAGMTGRLTDAQVGEQLSDIIIGGIYNTIAGGFAKQISDVFMTQIMTPIMTAITAGVPLSQAISQAAIDKVVETAQKAAEAMRVIFQNEAFLAAMEQIRSTIGSISVSTAGAAPYINSFVRSIDTTAQAADQAAKAAQDAAQRIKDAWRDMGDTLTDEIRRIKGEIVGDTSGGLAYTQAQFAIATAQARAGDMNAAKLLPELSRAVIELAKGSASSLSDLRVTQGATASSLIETRRILSQQYGFDVPAYAVGTDYVPRDMIAQIHEGEQIVPKAYNPANGYNNNAELVTEIRALRAEVASLRASSADTASATRGMESTINKVTQGGSAILTEAA